MTTDDDMTAPNWTAALATLGPGALARVTAALAKDPARLGRDEEETAQQRASRLELQAAAKRKLFEDLVPPVYLSARLDELHPQQDPHGKVRGFLDSGQSALVAVGPSRRGKSHSAYAVCFAARARGLAVYAIGAPELARRLRDTKYEGREEAAVRRDLFQTVQTVDVLLIDDLGAEAPDNWGTWREQLHEIVEARFAAGRRTIVTANAASREDVVAQLVERYSTPIVRRLLDRGVSVWIDGEALTPPATWNPFAAEEGR